ALARAVAERLVRHNGAFTLFATHYFELTQVVADWPASMNMHFDVADYKAGGEEQLVFLHALKPGPASRSFGLQVAALAGVPRAVTRKARRYLQELEARENDAGNSPQLGLFSATEPVPTETPDTPLLDALAEIDCDDLTPRQALAALYHLKALSQEAE